MGPLWMVLDEVRAKELGSKNCPADIFVSVDACCCSRGGCTTMEPLGVYCPAGAAVLVFTTLVTVVEVG